MGITELILKKLVKKSVMPRKNFQAAAFIGPGYATSKLGPGDHTGASYAFDIYDFANGTYRYEV